MSENVMVELVNNASENDPVFYPNGFGNSFKGINHKSNLKIHLIYVCGCSTTIQLYDLSKIVET